MRLNEKKTEYKRGISFILYALIIALLLVSCSPDLAETETGGEDTVSTSEELLSSPLPDEGVSDMVWDTLPPETPSKTYLFPDIEAEEKRVLIEDCMALSDRLNRGLTESVTREFISGVIDLYGVDKIKLILEAADRGDYTPETWHDVTGNTVNAIKDILKGSYDGYNVVREGKNGDTVTLGFGGDFMFSDDSIVTWQYNYRNKGVDGLFSPKVLEMMRGMDIMLLNCEYPISDTGKAMAGKKYVFRSSVKYTGVFNMMGVDIVSLANNHVYDYGKEAFFNTLTALDSHGIKRIGAGKDLDEARRVQYFTVNGRKIAYIAATRAEKNILTPGAGEDSPGVFRAYDSTLLKETVREARRQSDIVIVYIHWGAEHENRIESVIREQGKEYIDAGADFIIGAHAHQLQGIEFYKGKMIAYNLGNFLFNGWTTDTGLIETRIDSDGGIEHYFRPLLQRSTFLKEAEGEDSRRIWDYVKSISVNAAFESDGRIIER